MRLSQWQPDYNVAVGDENIKWAKVWRVAGWIVALLAIFVVAGPQILALFSR